MVHLRSQYHVVIIGLLLSPMNLRGMPALAQISPDQTLGSESSVVRSDVTLNGAVVDLIDGGATRGTNLFHSFDQFNVNESQHVYFNNPQGIESILTRVTGNDASDIMGTLGVNGNADLFLLNPNGIVFGENARLDIGGSFFATTAEGVQFESLGSFSSRDPEQPSPLLTISPSAFLFGQDPTGSIVNRSISTDTDGDTTTASTGLQVPSSQTLGLLGGDVVVDGGSMSALGGRIELGAVAGEGRVGLYENGQFQFADGIIRGAIRFQDNAVVDTASGGGGDIRIIAKTIDIISSVLESGIRTGEGSPEQQAGMILLDATDRIRLREGADDVESNDQPNAVISNSVAPNGIGEAGIIKVTAPVLQVGNGAQISASVFGIGGAGKVMIEASDRVIVDGISDTEDPLSGIFSAVEQDGSGRAGRIRITTPVLRVRNGANISSSVIGEGSGGNITINATERVVLDGTSPDGSNASGIFSVLNPEGLGDAGRIQITTPILNIRNGARINSSTLGQGDGGNVIINATHHLNLEGRESDDDANSFSRIASEAFSSSASDASDTSENTTSNALIPQSADSSEPLAGNAGRIKITTPILNVRDGAQIASSSHGAGHSGNITIEASDQFNMSDGTIHASSLDGASGQAGDITIATAIATVENQSRLLATTEDGVGGNISLTLDNLFLLGESNITAAAGREGAGGDGGNIVIDADFIVTLSNQDSDINANAFNGAGGNINIAAENLFNIEFQNQQLAPRNDITASSEFGLDGEVNIDSPNVDPSRGTITLPIDLVTVPPLDAICHPNSDTQSQFVMLGRGGLPIDPTDMLNSGGVATPWVTRDRPTPMSSIMVPPHPSTALNLREAEHWTTNENGRVVLHSSSPSYSRIGWSTGQSLCTS